MIGFQSRSTGVRSPKAYIVKVLDDRQRLGPARIVECYHAVFVVWAREAVVQLPLWVEGSRKRLSRRNVSCDDPGAKHWIGLDRTRRGLDRFGICAIQHQVRSVVEWRQSRCGVDSETTNGTRFQAKLGTQFLVGHSGETIDVTVQAQTEPTVRLLRITTEADDGGVIGFVREELRQEEAVFRIDKLRNRRLLRETDEPLPKLGRSFSDAPTQIEVATTSDIASCALACAIALATANASSR
jgi:hypothetical protein